MIISNSETDTYLRCRKLHFYRYILGLNPRKVSHPNAVGNLGHHILETYYRYQMEGASKKDAFHAGLQELVRATDLSIESPQVIELVMDRFIRYQKFYADDGFKIISVEGVYSIPMSEHVEFGMTTDLLVEYLSGPQKGQIGVIDHKFKASFDGSDALSMHVQTVKYLWGVKKLGYSAGKSVLNQIRYGPNLVDSEKIFFRQDILPTQIQTQNIMDEHLQVSEEIFRVKQKPKEWIASHSPRRANPQECKGCYFRLPCRQELLGKDPAPTFNAMFTTVQDTSFYKPYGY